MKYSREDVTLSSFFTGKNTALFTVGTSDWTRTGDREFQERKCTIKKRKSILNEPLKK